VNASKNVPIFQSIFAEHWDDLPVVIEKHYANRPCSNDRVTVKGVMDVSCKGYMNLLKPFYRILGSIPVVSASDVPVTVNFDSAPDTQAFHFNRVFHFNNRPYQFRSRMLQVGGGEVIEVMRFGICWQMNYSWDGNQVTLRHKGYALSLFGYLLPLPITALVGRGDATETAIDDDHFDMEVKVTHPIFGVVYSYGGRFRVIQEA